MSNIVYALILWLNLEQDFFNEILKYKTMLKIQHCLPIGIGPIGPMCPGIGGQYPMPGMPCIMLGMGIWGMGGMLDISGLILDISFFEEDSPSLSTVSTGKGNADY